jgi:hypothetical protein
MIAMKFDPVFVYGNYVEAAVWAAMGVIALLRLPTRAGVALAALLIAFGISDLVETTTGAWYRPWWLLAWKATCVIGVLAIGVPLWQRARRKRVQTENTADRSK